LHSGRGILLECSIGDLETAQGTDTKIQDGEEQECSHEAHEDACKEVSTANRNGWRSGYEPGVKNWYSSKRDVDLVDEPEALPDAE
jgi:hypothetical protein